MHNHVYLTYQHESYVLNLWNVNTCAVQLNKAFSIILLILCLGNIYIKFGNKVEDKLKIYNDADATVSLHY